MSNSLRFRVWFYHQEKFQYGGLEMFSKFSFPLDWCAVQRGTGLKDSTGKEIFEGDIVSTIYQEDPKLAVGEVIFDQFTCAYRIQTKETKLPIVTVGITVDGVFQNLIQVANKIIGNVFQNPELLT